MNGSLRFAWEHFGADLWTPLSEYSNKEVGAPLDLFSDLFAAADDFLSPRPTDAELEETRNDPLKAQQRFLGLKGSDFGSESDLVHFLEEVYEVVTDYEILGFEEYYRRLLSGALRGC